MGFRICAAVIVLKRRKVRKGTGTVWRVGIKVVGEGLTDSILEAGQCPACWKNRVEDPHGGSRGREGRAGWRESSGWSGLGVTRFERIN